MPQDRLIPQNFGKSWADLQFSPVANLKSITMTRQHVPSFMAKEYLWGLSSM